MTQRIKSRFINAILEFFDKRLIHKQQSSKTIYISPKLGIAAIYDPQTDTLDAGAWQACLSDVNRQADRNE